MRRILRAIWRILTAPFRWIGVLLSELSQFLTEEPEDTPLGDSFQKAVEHPQDLLYHLNALRKHLFRAIGFLFLTTVLSFAFTSQIIDFLAQPVGGIGKLIAIDPTEPIGVFMRVALLSGFALAFPYIALELWLFAAPGLRKDSRLFALAAIPIATLFFLGGMAFAYFVMMPRALPFLLNFMGLTTQARPSSYIRFVTGVMFWIGVAFEFPLAIYVLARIGLVRGEMLAHQWRLAIVIIAVAAAAITPTVDPVNMALVMGPMIVLYFLSIALAYLAQRGRLEAQTGD
ncbi:MAG: twin-arginine translocase subunit TatC [Anaerolineales bacterium]|jgi:sec-independent protein translocase protein TatC